MCLKIPGSHFFTALNCEHGKATDPYVKSGKPAQSVLWQICAVGAKLLSNPFKLRNHLMVKQLMLENSGVSNLQGQAPAVMAAIIPAAPPPNLALSSKTHQIQRSGENKHVKQFEENVFEYLNPGRRLNIDQVLCIHAVSNNCKSNQYKV